MFTCMYMHTHNTWYPTGLFELVFACYYLNPYMMCLKTHMLLQRSCVLVTWTLCVGEGGWEPKGQSVALTITCSWFQFSDWVVCYILQQITLLLLCHPFSNWCVAHVHLHKVDLVEGVNLWEHNHLVIINKSSVW